MILLLRKAYYCCVYADKELRYVSHSLVVYDEEYVCWIKECLSAVECGTSRVCE